MMLATDMHAQLAFHLKILGEHTEIQTESCKTALRNGLLSTARIGVPCQPCRTKEGVNRKRASDLLSMRVTFCTVLDLRAALTCS